MIRKIGSSIAIQSLGTLSGFAVVWLITRYLGVSKQGEFALLKSWIDLLVVIGCFGFPQSFIYTINKLNTSAQILKRFSSIYPVAIFTVASILSYFWFHYSSNVISFSTVHYVFIGAAIAGLVGHGLLRGIFLTQNDGKKFALISILPALGLFVFIGLGIFVDIPISLPLAYVLTGLIAFIIMLWLVKPSSGGRALQWRPILLNGNSIFLQGLAMTLLPMTTYWLMSYFGMDKKAIGGFNIAVYCYLAFALPLNMVSPIFFNRWSKNHDKAVLSKELKRFLWIGLPILPISLFLAYLLKYIVPYVFGGELEFAIPSMQILLSAGILVYATNLLSCMNIAMGSFTSNTRAYILKVAASIIFIFGSLSLFQNDLKMVALSWLLGDLSLLMILFTLVTRSFKTQRKSV
ncbi:MATE family efflux transporter [Paralysiella testudinis]|uniref:Polysaccharide biosynthesis protein n=1 Tax=Paralysiella testudinis TaxID=2809020 RepID=A0A892ZKW5_9NEIS|nr:hypothetical protein [Paralysiella testudinis]QRQ82437.1 hypothetical protein JQU52_03240 [Paralysiella testudinis]